MKGAIALARWFDSWAGLDRAASEGRGEERDRVDWLRVLPFVALHACCLLVIRVGWSWTAVSVAVVLYVLRMFALTGFYHRYFSHRSFRTTRVMQFVFAVLGATAVQRGPLWWASHHRVHHQVTDQPEDPHSPDQQGFWWSHMGWFMASGNFRPRFEKIRDLLRFPELRFLDRFDAVVPAVTAGALFLVGEVLRIRAPGLGTSGAQLLVWGAASTIVLFHASSSINSLAHRFGWRRYETPDASRNSLALAMVTLGEGWHNNHHAFQAPARQGHRWWEIDLTWVGLLVLERIGLIWDLKPLPERARAPVRTAAR